VYDVLLTVRMQEKTIDVKHRYLTYGRIATTLDAIGQERSALKAYAYDVRRRRQADDVGKLIIIIISPQQSTAGHGPLQFLAGSLDLRPLASSSCQPSCVNRHSTWTEGVLHYVYRDAVSTPQLVYPSGCRFYG
jgi:hypothetical protein